jgi:hypothetical protein
LSQIGERRTVLEAGGSVHEFLEVEEQQSELIKQLSMLASYNGQLIGKYELLDNAYRASGGFETGEYLIPHPSERAEKYVRRKNMSYFINYVKPVVDAHVNPIFKTEPMRSGLSSTASLFEKDVDGKKTTLTRFMKKAAIRAKLHGVEFIVVDMEQVEEDRLLTEKDVVDQRLYPYLYLVSPAQVTNWYTDKLGRLVSISYTIDNYVLDKDGNAVNKPETWTWTSTVCKKVVDGETQTFQNPVGIIPIIPLYGAINDSNNLIPQSDLYAIARTNHALYNACSELRERNRAQAFSLLTYPIADEDDYENGDEPLRYGTADMIMYRGGKSAAKPEFITPPSDSSDIIMNEINFCIKEIYRMATLQMTTGVNQYNVSGTAREWDNQQLFQTISELGQGLQEAEKSIMYVFSKYMNEDMKEFSVVYNNQYGIIDAATTLANATSALTMNISEEYNEEMRKQVVRATLKDVDANIVDKLVESVEKSPTGKQPLEPGQVSVVQPTGM